MNDTINVLSVNAKGPNLDSDKYVKIAGVPILDVHERDFFRAFYDESGNKTVKKVKEVVEVDQLTRLARNSQENAERGDYGLVFLGHTDDDGPEKDQPEIVGFMKNYRIGNHVDRPTIFADLYIKGDKDKAENLMFQFPRRSAEVIRKNHTDGYVDSLALIKRAPERSLGLIADLYHKTKTQIDRFMCPECEAESGGQDMGAVMNDQLLKKVSKSLVSALGSILQEVFQEDDPSGGLVGAVDSEEDQVEEQIHPGIHEQVMEEEEAHPGGVGLHPEQEEAAHAAGIDTGSGDDEREDYCGPSPTNVSPPSMNNNMNKNRRLNPRVNYSIDESEVERMGREQENIQVSRFEKRLAALETRIGDLTKENTDLKRQRKIDRFERSLIQLEAEGRQFNRAKLVDRFAKDLSVGKFQSDDDIKEELDFIKDSYRRSPVGQDMIFGIGDDSDDDAPGNVIADNGGNTVPENAGASPMREIQRHEKTTGIYGDEIVRFSKAKEVQDEIRGESDPMSKAIAVGRAFQSSRRRKTS